MILNQYNINGLTINELLIEIGVSVRRKRINRQLTQKALAARSGVNLNTVINIERGNNTGLDKLLAILRELGELPGFYNFLLRPEPILPSVVFQTQKKEPQRVREKKKKN